MSGSPVTSQATSEQLLQQALAANARGDVDNALRLFGEAIALTPGNATLHNELGVHYYHRGMIPEARDAFHEAVRLDPQFSRALTNLGACHNELGDNLAAITCHEKAMTVDPTMVDAWANAGKAWNELEEFEMAIACYRRAMVINPRPDVQRGLAKAYRKSGRYDRSRQLLLDVVQQKPADADAHFGLALTHFHLEEYAEAVKEFEWRMQVKEMIQHRKDLHPIFDRPAWSGQDLTDKTLLIHTEQGFGDNLQFARFIELVRPHVGKLVMWCRPGLGRLFKHCFDVADISENVFKLPAFDYQLPLLSIPFHFDPALATLDSFAPYICAPARDKPLFVTEPTSLNIGLVWGASDSGFDHQNKKVPLNLLKPLLDIPGTAWHSLQVGSDKTDISNAEVAGKLIDLAPKLGDFADTASAVDQLDLVISCDTSVAHLVGAMGKPLWMMLKKNPDWRWHSDGENTAWYPTARLYRQDTCGDWSRVVRRISRDLIHQVSAHQKSTQP
ncbi:MAG: hypothetical protein VR73_11760 [Gammaproteobacteria bacterium BRH_c0]|nr:MAG: hypothetical protein VR73_11760 [Gammaproteobacteria bacterium BRH_c0]